MPRKKIMNLFLMGMFLFFSCTKKKEYTKEELVEYMEDPGNGIIKTNKPVNNIDMKVSYRPWQLVFSAMEEGGSGIDSLESSGPPYCYFIFSISRNEGELLGKGFNTREEFSVLLNKLAFQMQDYVYVTTSGSDTVYAADHTMPRTFGMAQATNIQFAFESEKITKADWMDLTVNDFGIGTGTQKFRFEVKDLKETDNIILKKQ